MLADLALIFLWVPTDATMGIVQRVFYFHVPSAWVGFLAFFVVFVGSIAYLVKPAPRWDALAHSAAEIGTLFMTIVLITGPIWARPVWGVWWTWSPQLTTSLILWLIYVAYLMLRAYAPTQQQAARYSAVLGIIGFVDVPIIYFAAILWRDIHPEKVVGPMAERGSLAPEMLFVFLFSVLTFTVLFVMFLQQRLTVRRAEDTLAQARRASSR
ncbi:MAG: cytochrome c biogenesis protein CcsA [Chloroflexi bacterium]|nr:cytochrome c biogenesis protein CcsA [Chloroflexota bacterium]